MDTLVGIADTCDLPESEPAMEALLKEVRKIPSLTYTQAKEITDSLELADDRTVAGDSWGESIVLQELGERLVELGLDRRVVDRFWNEVVEGIVSSQKPQKRPEKLP